MLQAKHGTRLLVTCLLVLTLCGCCASKPRAAAAAHSAPALQRFEETRPKLATSFRIVLYAPDEPAAAAAFEAAFARVDALNAIYSDYDERAELARLTQTHGTAVPVSPELFALLQTAQDAARASGGAFDITCGVQVKLWRLARHQKTMPLPERLVAAKERTGSTLLELDATQRTARLAKEGMRLDLGGIAKGAIADEVLALLKARGLEHALVAAGGDVRAGAPPPGQSGWRVGVAAFDVPLAANVAPERLLTLRHAAVSTSGGTEQFVELNGVRYAHIVDPATGLGLTTRRSATVVAPTATQSDWLATALCVLGKEKGLALIEATPGCAALIREQTANGLEVTASQRWVE